MSSSQPRPRVWALALVLVVTLCFGQQAFAQAGGSENDEETISVHGYAVYGYSGGIQIGYGWYPTQAEAQAAKGRMEKIEVTNGKYYDKVTIEPETRIVPKSKYLPKLRLKPNRRPGDVLREYRSVLKKARDNVVNLKQSLTSRTGTIAQKQFRDVNNLIASFNQQRDEAIRSTGDSFRDIPSISAVAEADLAGRLEGDTAGGSAPGDNGNAGNPQKSIVVKVYKNVNRKWVEVPSSRYETADNYDEASKYYWKIKGMKSYTPTWNAPGWPKPKIDKPDTPNVDVRPYNPPKEESNAAQKAFRPGTYLDSFDNGDGTGVRRWTLTLSENGAIQGNLKWGSKTLNVLGMWKFENGSLWIQWQGGDFRGTPKWHEEKEYVRWKRIND